MNYVRFMPEDRMVCLPKGKGAGPAIQHHGGGCPVDPMQPISVWWCSDYHDQEWWHPIRMASQHDWSNPCIYRVRKPHAGHPMARRSAKQPESITIASPLEIIASDFTRLVDAVENYLARCDAQAIEARRAETLGSVHESAVHAPGD